MGPRHLLISNFTEEQQLFNHPSITNYIPNNQEFFNPYIYYPISTKFPQYAQCEV